MINRIFFIQELTSSPPPGDIFQPDNSLLPEKNIFYSILVNPRAEGSLDKAYIQIAGSDDSLSLAIRSPLIPDDLRSITSFLFLPSYLRIDGRPVLFLAGDTPELSLTSASLLSSYIEAQGVDNAFVHPLLLPAMQDFSYAGNPFLPALSQIDRVFYSSADLSQYYKGLLQSARYYHNDLFFYSQNEEDRRSAFLHFLRIERDFQKQFPRLYELTLSFGLLEEQYRSLTKQQAAALMELDNQRQYIDILRSNHQAKEIQDFYNREYEILPLWYKRFGHILKTLTGKRAFRSLFRDDVKKYKN